MNDPWIDSWLLSSEAYDLLSTVVTILIIISLIIASFFLIPDHLERSKMLESCYISCGNGYIDDAHGEQECRNSCTALERDILRHHYGDVQ